MREEDTQFVDDLLDLKGTIMAIGPTQAYLEWVLGELYDKVGPFEKRSRKDYVILLDKNVHLKTLATLRASLCGCSLDDFIVHPAVHDLCSDSELDMLCAAIYPALELAKNRA